MELRIRDKYSNKSKFLTKGTTKSDAEFSVFMLDTMCRYAVSANKNIRKSQLVSLQKLFEMLDIERNFANDEQKMKRIDFINRALDARLNYGLTDRNMILSHVLGPSVDPESYGLDDVDNDTLNWVNDTVSEALKDSYICGDIGHLMGVLTEFKQTEYKDRGPVLKRVEQAIIDMNNKFRTARVERNSETMFSLRSGVFEDCVKDYHEQFMNPANKLVTGMQGLNEMLAGGFESGRTYMLFGLPGEGKSTSMLDIAYQIKKYNKNFQTKDPTKMPCVVILTMENSPRESFERLFNMTASVDSIVNFSAEEVIQLLRTKGELYLADDNPIDIIIKYVPGNTVDTSYLYTLTEDLEDEGYEVICMIQDYVKKINSVNIHSSTEVRLELGAVINEFKSYAIAKDIPIISASQLNRDATKHIDEGRKATKADLVKLLGRSNIGESMLMLENVDAAFMIAPEWTDGGTKKFLGIQNIKTRYKNSGKLYIYQPYVEGNAIKLVEDYYDAEPAYKETLSTGIRMNGTGTVSGIANKSGYIKNNIRDIGDLELNGATNTFKTPNMIEISSYDDEEEEDDDEVMLNGKRPMSYNPYRDGKPTINPFVHIVNPFIHIA